MCGRTKRKKGGSDADIFWSDGGIRRKSNVNSLPRTDAVLVLKDLWYTCDCFELELYSISQVLPLQ